MSTKTKKTVPAAAEAPMVEVSIETSKTENRGRKVSQTSARQIRLASYKAKAEAGFEVKRGRPSGSKQKIPTVKVVADSIEVTK